MAMENNATPRIEDASDWYNAKTKLTIMGKRERIVTEPEMNIEALRQIRAHFNVNIRGGKRRYYDEWEAFLRLGKDDMIAQVKRTRFAPGSTHYVLFEGEMTDENVWKYICDEHGSTWCDMAEARYYIMNFFRLIKEYYPDLKDDLQALDNQFWRASVIMGGNDGNGYGTEIGDPVKPEIFEKQDVRECMADCVRQFREADAKGLEMVEKLLDRIGI